ncbi:MAG: hypothetical protein HOE90_01380 [Bacteriovoracaceae bacterium]|jgi:hypothetical protein|nr:hypothetical protein [Bacteriovoracaceae bacterium]
MKKLLRDVSRISQIVYFSGRKLIDPESNYKVAEEGILEKNSERESGVVEQVVKICCSRRLKASSGLASKESAYYQCRVF